MRIRPSRPDRMVSVFVPISVAVIGLIGVVVAALIATQQDGGGTVTPDTVVATVAAPTGTSDNSGPSITVTGWGSRYIPPPPHIELRFHGESTGLAENQQIFILAQFVSPQSADRPSSATPSYQVSPPANVDDSGAWTVIWVLLEPPASVSYTAVIARITVPTTASGGSPTPTPQSSAQIPAALLIALRQFGASAPDVLAQDSVDMLPDAL
jgi:hypothetical protein